MEYFSAPPDNSGRRVVYTERRGDVGYTYYDDGIVKITHYRRRRKVYWGRIAIAVVVLILLIMGLVQVIKIFTGGSKKDSSDSDKQFVFESSSAAEADTTVSTADEDVSKTSAASAESSEEEPNAKKMGFKVCIDPGHGDYDTGVLTGEGLTESSKNLEFAKLVQEQLEAEGVEVLMTRTEDVNVPITKRCSMANEAGCDFFVSLHRNGTSDPFDGSCGTEIFINNASPEMDKKLATNILDALDQVGITRSLGVSAGFSGKPESNYQINTDTLMPSCQLELGYLTSDDDNALYESMKQDYAIAVTEALVKTAKELGVIDENGSRLITEPLISEGKSHITVSLDGEVGMV